uniref:Uncharacterized protein n=1 Tax=Arion vulgaris TaxID=1028688 RepID=A0A0B7BC41_9EUPU
MPRDNNEGDFSDHCLYQYLQLVSSHHFCFNLTSHAHGVTEYENMRAVIN